MNTDTNKRNFEEVDLRSLIGVLWRRRVVVILFFLLSVVLGTALSYAGMSSVYQASALISLGSYGKEFYTNPSSAKQLISSDEFLAKVSEELRRENKEEVRKEEIIIEILRDNRHIRIFVRKKDPQLANAAVDKMVLLFVREGEVEYRKRSDYIAYQLAVVKAGLEEVENDVVKTRKAVNDLDKLFDSSLEGSDDKTRSILLDIDRSFGSSLERELVRTRFLDHLGQAEARRLNLSMRLFDLQSEIDSLKKVELVKTADVTSIPTKPHRETFVISAGVLGILMGILIVLFTEYVKWNPIRRRSQL